MLFRLHTLGGEGAAKGSSIFLDYHKIVSVTQATSGCTVRMVNGDTWTLAVDFSSIVLDLQTLGDE